MAAVIHKEQNLDWARPGPGLIGELLKRAGRLNDAQVAMVLAAQRERGLRFGEVAIALGLLQEADLRHALSHQFDYSVVEYGASNLDSTLFAAYEPLSAQSEALRQLRSELKLRWFSGERRSLCVLEARGGIESGRLAANLAIAFSQAGDRTLLIDTNLRAPRQRELFGLADDEGLTQILGGRLSLADGLAGVQGFAHLSLLCAGAAVPNPQELLSRSGFSDLMEVLPSSFDVIIATAPPLLEYADAQLIAARCGGCLLVTERDSTRVSDIEMVQARLAPSGAKLVGAVMLGA
jgi:chain length determinant protein tyrosine kinase EpsG